MQKINALALYKTMILWNNKNLLSMFNKTCFVKYISIFARPQRGVLHG